MAPAIAAILRVLIGRGAAAAVRPAAAGVARGGVRAAGQKGVRGIAQRVFQRFASPATKSSAAGQSPQPRGVQGLMQRVFQRFASPAQPSGAAATRPTVNYAQMLSNMGTQTAYQDAVQPPQTTRQRGLEHLKTMGKGLASASGVSNFFESQKKFRERDYLGAFTELAKAIGKVVTSFIGIPLAVKKWSEGLVESRRELAKYNGTISAAYIRLNASQIRGQIMAASGNAGSTAKLVDSFRQLTESMRPMNRDIMTVVNTMASGVIKMATELSNMYTALRGKWKWLADKLDEIEKNGRKEAPKDNPGQDFVRGVARGDFLGNGQRPPLPPLK